MLTIVTLIAQLCHGLNKAICEAAGDFSQVPWDEATNWQKQTAINGVLFRLANLDATAEEQHKQWVADKLADGWLPGDVKSEEKKTHPCLVPYVDLPFEQRVKDHVFKAATEFIAKNLQMETPENVELPTAVQHPGYTGAIQEVPTEHPAHEEPLVSLGSNFDTENNPVVGNASAPADGSAGQEATPA